MSFKDLLWESESKQEVTPPKPIPVAQTTAGYPIGAPAATGTIADTDDAYQRLFSKTDWTQLPVFVSINKYLAPVAGFAIDEKVKFGIAIKQAQAQDGSDPLSINQTFETLKSTLQQASDAFANSLASKVESEVNAKKKQAEDLQAQVVALTEQALAAQQKLDAASKRFNQAAQTRLAEITQEQTKYASLLA